MSSQHQQPDEREEKPRKKISINEGLSDPYQVLDIPRTATDAEIKKAYFAKVRLFPPEREPEKFKEIRAAYDALRTPEARAGVDLFLLHFPQPYQAYKRSPAFDLAFHPEDWLQLAKAHSDLGRFDFQEDFRELEK
jgi:curved DNA-binding protein CbpA